ncbi:MAG TPA: BadF/BadG/BcrA/BcrD ATPase family protein [Vicinamibacterales bacterium]|nr:BadF/BadG/BcrA/BcrD ATPase family protein [Vicinamibacterales bacterium]
MHVLGIDAGGTKTVALLADASGHIVGDGRAGGANLQTDGELEVEKTLHAVIDGATRGLRIVPAAVCLGIAGVDRPRDGDVIRGIMVRLGFRTNAVIVNDALIALVAGAGANPGVVVISGTGSIAYGVNHRGVAARAGGWGPTLGDEGSGYWIGKRALEAVARDVDGRGPQTSLTPLVLDHFALPRPEALVSEVYHHPQGRRAVAALGPLVDRARAEGDMVAGEIMTAAADELGLAAASVISRLEMRGERFPILLSGGMLKTGAGNREREAGSWLAVEVLRRMAEVAPRSEVRPLTDEPAIGAVSLALAEANGGVRVPPYIDASRPARP